MTLRDVARRLAAILKMAETRVAIHKLSTLLKSGELKTGFHVPGRIVSWITILPSFWAKIGHDKLRSLVYDSDDEDTRPGIFKVKIADFADEYVRAVQAELKENTQDKADIMGTLLEELRVALSAAAGQYEVLVPERDWVDYLTRHNLSEPAPETKSKPGRGEKSSWRSTSAFIGAYLIHHYRTMPEAEFKLDTASEEINKAVVAEGVSDPPSAASIKAVLSDSRKKAKTTFD